MWWCTLAIWSRSLHSSSEAVSLVEPGINIVHPRLTITVQSPRIHSLIVSDGKRIRRMESTEDVTEFSFGHSSAFLIHTYVAVVISRVLHQFLRLLLLVPAHHGQRCICHFALSKSEL